MRDEGNGTKENRDANEAGRKAATMGGLTRWGHSTAVVLMLDILVRKPFRCVFMLLLAALLPVDTARIFLSMSLVGILFTYAAALLPSQLRREGVLRAWKALPVSQLHVALAMVFPLGLVLLVFLAGHLLWAATFADPAPTALFVLQFAWMLAGALAAGLAADALLWPAAASREAHDNRVLMALGAMVLCVVPLTLYVRLDESTLGAWMLALSLVLPGITIPLAWTALRRLLRGASSAGRVRAAAGAQGGVPPFSIVHRYSPYLSNLRIGDYLILGVFIIFLSLASHLSAESQPGQPWGLDGAVLGFALLAALMLGFFRLRAWLDSLRESRSLPATPGRLAVRLAAMSAVYVAAMYMLIAASSIVVDMQAKTISLADLLMTRLPPLAAGLLLVLGIFQMVCGLYCLTGPSAAMFALILSMACCIPEADALWGPPGVGLREIYPAAPAVLLKVSLLGIVLTLAGPLMMYHALRFRSQAYKRKEAPC